jgi:hypothetical protein
MIAKDKDFMHLWYVFTLRLRKKYRFFSEISELEPNPSSSNSEEQWPVATFDLLLCAFEDYNNQINLSEDKLKAKEDELQETKLELEKEK